MILRTTVPLFVCLALGIAVGSALPQRQVEPRVSLIALERQALDAVKRKDMAAIMRLTAPEYRGILHPEGQENREQMLHNIAHFSLTDYTIQEVSSVWLSPQAGVVTYTVSYQGAYKGEPLSGKPLLASAVWMCRDGQWMCVLYQETPHVP